MNLALIAARVGGNRLPRENIKFFAGKPLIAYSIEVAKASGLFDKIIISVASEDVAEVAKDCLRTELMYQSYVQGQKSEWNFRL